MSSFGDITGHAIIMIYNFTEKYSQESVFEVAKALWGLDKEVITRKGRPKVRVSTARIIMIAVTKELFNAKIFQLEEMFNVTNMIIYKSIKKNKETLDMTDYYSKEYQENYEAFKTALQAREII